jgi:hypothetical protein
MEPVAFREADTVFAKDQPQYLPLPAHRNEEGIVTSCWRMGIAERLKALLTGRICVQAMTFNSPLQPIKLTTKNPL